MCTPNDKPTTKLINTNHLFPLGYVISLSHLNPSQNNNAIKKEDIAYTSPSTALNQKLSEKVYAKAPTKPLPKTAIASSY